MSDRIEAEILDVLGEEVAADVDTPLVVIQGPKGDPGKDGVPGVYYGTTPPTGDTHPVWIDPDGGPDDGGLLPAVTAADNGKVLRVVSSAWGPADMPTGGTDMGITGATVGQIAKITAVDESGVPTAWAPVDMPSGGSSEFVINGTLNDDDALTVDKTYAQIQEAVQGGKRVTLKVNKYAIDISLPLIGENDTGYIFEASLTVFPTVSLLFFASVSASGNSWNTDQLIVADSSGNLVQISMDRDPEQPMEIATKQYVDASGVPSVTAADNGKVLRVDNGAWTAADMPTGGTDMGITGAKVGQIAKITAVDASGVPTAWEPVDLPGGGGDEWVKVAETTLTEIANEIRLNFDPCKAVYIEFQYGAVEGNLGVIGIYPNPQTPIYTSEKRTCAVDTTTSDKNKRGYIFCTIDRRKGTQWVATSQIFHRGDGAFGSIQPGNTMNCDIWVGNDNTWASLLLKEKLVGTDYINSVSAFGAGMNIGTTLTVWGIKA